MLDVEAIMQSLWATVALFGYCIEYGRTYGWIKTSYFYLFAYKKKEKKKKTKKEALGQIIHICLFGWVGDKYY